MTVRTDKRIADYLSAWGTSLLRDGREHDPGVLSRANQLLLAAKSIRSGDWKHTPR